MRVIDNFRGKYYFLSNFFTAKVIYDGLVYENNEAAFQSAKTLNEDRRLQYTTVDPSTAKGMGRREKLRTDWESVKDEIMYQIVSNKFHTNAYLADRLIATGDAILIEGNTWNDTYWGVCNGVGENKLGQILMRVREEIRNEA